MRRGGRAAVIARGRRTADGCRPQSFQAVPIAIAALESTASRSAPVYDWSCSTLPNGGAILLHRIARYPIERGAFTHI